jgi:hypothetical protein
LQFKHGAELATALVYQTKKSGQNIYACANNKGNFTKKRRIDYFECKDGHLIEQAIQETIATGGTNLLMKSIGTDEKEYKYLKWILNGVRAKINYSFYYRNN